MINLWQEAGHIAATTELCGKMPGNSCGTYGECRKELQAHIRVLAKSGPEDETSVVDSMGAQNLHLMQSLQSPYGEVVA